MWVQKIIIKSKASYEVIDVLLATLKCDYSKFFSDLPIRPEKN